MRVEARPALRWNAQSGLPDLLALNSLAWLLASIVLRGLKNHGGTLRDCVCDERSVSKFIFSQRSRYFMSVAALAGHRVRCMVPQNFDLKVFKVSAVKKKLPPRLKEIYDFVNDTYTGPTTPESHSRTKRREMQRDGELTTQTATTADGSTLPSTADGWQQTRPDNPELYISAVRTVRMTDGSSVKLFKVLIRPEVLKAKQRTAKKLLKRARRDNAEAEAKQAKRHVRLMLALLGKR
jgi:hypothetical protein